MKILGLIIAFVLILASTNYALKAFAAAESAGRFDTDLYVTFYGSMIFGACVVSAVSYLRGRRPWLWFILALPSPAIALVVLIAKRNEGWGWD